MVYAKGGRIKRPSFVSGLIIETCCGSMTNKKRANRLRSKSELDRRSFLLTSAFVAGGAAAFSVIKSSTVAGAPITDSPIASTRWGKVRGYVDNGINVFKGIRYGRDTSSRRFMGPVPPEPWSDVRDALAYGSASPQPSRSNEKPNEDCLFLNVWTPGLRDEPSGQ